MPRVMQLRQNYEHNERCPHALYGIIHYYMCYIYDIKKAQLELLPPHYNFYPRKQQYKASEIPRYGVSKMSRYEVSKMSQYGAKKYDKTGPAKFNKEPAESVDIEPARSNDTESVKEIIRGQ